MGLGNRFNDYSFAQWLSLRQVNAVADEPFLQQCIMKYVPDGQSLIPELIRFADVMRYRWEPLIAECAQVENRPRLVQYDAYGNRIDRIERPPQMRQLEKEIFGLGLFSPAVSPWERFIKMMLLNENGEFCIMCPLLCTEGLIRAIEELAGEDGGRPEVAHILHHCRDGIEGDFGIGAQFLSEIQGGSDVPANLLEAEFDGKEWRLYGTKFFCSAMHADYFIITAKPVGSEKVAMFLMPAWLPGDKERERRNGYTIDRLKWKLGTVELPTAEVTFRGGIAYPLGPLDRGVANVVGIVLSYSRLGVGATTAGSIIRAAREARIYAEFREAFGLKIGQFPLLAAQLAEIEATCQRAIAGAFELFDLFQQVGGKFSTAAPPGETLEHKKRRFMLRELVLLAKMYNSKVSTATIHDAMSVFGGHGVMEDFTVLPRLYRDSNVNELWEGPRNVLLTQVFNDFKRNADWYSASEFVADCLEGYDQHVVRELTERLEAVLSLPNLYTNDERTIRMAAEWDRLADDFMKAYQENARLHL